MKTSTPEWIEKAKSTYNFHHKCLISTENWTLRKTAHALKRSLGSVSEDITIARFCKHNEERLKEFDYAYEALAFIRKELKRIEGEEIK